MPLQHAMCHGARRMVGAVRFPLFIFCIGLRKQRRNTFFGFKIDYIWHLEGKSLEKFWSLPPSLFFCVIVRLVTFPIKIVIFKEWIFRSSHSAPFTVHLIKTLGTFLWFLLRSPTLHPQYHNTFTVAFDKASILLFFFFWD